MPGAGGAPQPFSRPKQAPVVNGQSALPSPVDLNIDPYTPYVNGVDPYAVDQGGTYDAFIQYLFNSPQYQNGSGLGGKTVSQNLELLKKYEDITGVPFMQLLGDPGGSFAQPEQSKTRQVYGGNPTFDQAFANVDIGQDPISVVNDMVNNPDKYGIDTSKVNVKDSAWQEQMLNVVTDYSYENVAAREANAGKENTYTLPSGEKIKGDPNIWQRKSQFELSGAPAVEDLMSQYANSRMPKYDKKAADMKFRVGQRRAVEYKPSDETPIPSEDQQWQDYQTGLPEAAPAPMSRTGSEQFSKDFAAHNKAMYDQKRAESMARLFDPNSPLGKAMFAAISSHADRAKRTMVASDAERALVMKLMAARALAG